jgi:predicted dehydrogenase
VAVLDLIHGFLGMPARAVAFLHTAVWQLQPLEDNAFATMTFGSGAVAQFHTGMTQWKNLFSLEVHGEAGAASVEGLAGSYGPQRLVEMRRRMGGGPPKLIPTEYPAQDVSWQHEWQDFAEGMTSGQVRHGRAADGVRVMRMLEALYVSAQEGQVIEVSDP